MKLTIISATRDIHSGEFISSVNSLPFKKMEFINSNPTGHTNNYIDKRIKQIPIRHSNFSKEVNDHLDRMQWYNDSGWYNRRILLPCIREIRDADYVLIAHEDVSFTMNDINFLKGFIDDTNIAASCAAIKSINGIDKLGDRFLLIKKDNIQMIVSALMNCGNISNNTVAAINIYIKQYNKSIFITGLVK